MIIQVTENCCDKKNNGIPFRQISAVGINEKKPVGNIDVSLLDGDVGEEINFGQNMPLF